MQRKRVVVMVDEYDSVVNSLMYKHVNLSDPKDGMDIVKQAID